MEDKKIEEKEKESFKPITLDYSTEPIKFESSRKYDDSYAGYNIFNKTDEEIIAQQMRDEIEMEKHAFENARIKQVEGRLPRNPDDVKIGIHPISSQEIPLNLQVFTGTTATITSGAQISSGVYNNIEQESLRKYFMNTEKEQVNPAKKVKVQAKTYVSPKSPERDRDDNDDIRYYINKILSINKEVTVEKLHKWFGKDYLQEIIEEKVSKLTPEPVVEGEEIVVNFNELADDIAKFIIKQTNKEFLPDVHLNQYNDLVTKVLGLINKNNRKNNE